MEVVRGLKLIHAERYADVVRALTIIKVERSANSEILASNYRRFKETYDLYKGIPERVRKMFGRDSEIEQGIKETGY